MELSDLLRQDVQWSPVSHLSLVPYPSIMELWTGTCYHVFMWVLRFWIQVLILVQQALYHLPNPPLSWFYHFINYWFVILKTLSQDTFFFFHLFPWLPGIVLGQAWYHPQPPGTTGNQDKALIFKTCVSIIKQKRWWDSGSCCVYKLKILLYRL